MGLRNRLSYWHALAADLFHLPVRQRRPDPFHEVFAEFVTAVQGLASPTVLELGSRNVTGATSRQHFRNAGRYIGFDVHPGEGVDLVGDAHRLSTLVAPGSVDAAFSISVFEHLVYPWKVILELNRVLKPGGYLFISTHPAWPAHELPWDFWRFPVAGLLHLLVPGTGFEVISATEGLPAKIYSLTEDAATRGLRHFQVNLAVGILARKVGDYDADKLRWDLDASDVLTTEYPRPT